MENLLAVNFFAFSCDLKIFLAYEINIFIFSYDSWLAIFSQSTTIVIVCSSSSRIIKILTVIVVVDNFRVIIEVILFIDSHLTEFSGLNKRVIRKN